MSHPSKTEVAAAVPARVEHLESRRLFAAPFSDADLAGDVVLITESERATIQPRGNLQIPAGTLTTTDGVDHAVNGNYIVRTNGIIGVSLSALDLDQQGFDGWLNSSKDVAIGINGALGPDPTPPEQQDLALILKHSLIFSPADLLGTWRIHGTHASGSLAFDGTGKVIGGEITSGSAQPATITGGTYIISQQGDVSVTVTTGSGTTALALRGTLNNSKDVLGLTRAAGDPATGDMDLTVMVRAEPTTSATNAALTGDFGLSLDGRLVPLGFDGNGHIVPGLQLQSGLDTTATGTYAVGANHSFTATVTITDAAGKATTWALNGTVNRAGDVAAISATPAAGGATMLGMMAKSDPPFVVWTGGGSLGVRGTIGNDIVVVSEKNGVISISQNGQTEVFSGNVNYLEVRTGEGNDKVLVVGKVTSVIVDGGPGNDTLMGGERRDSLYGGAGKDYLDGGGDKDLLKGGAGPDVILTGGSFTDPFAVSDRAYGGGGNDTITGGAGRDNLYGEGGNDRIAGGDGSDLLDGGANNDTLDAGKGADTLAGGGGNDRLFGGEGFGLFLGGAGDDIIVSRDNAAESVVGGTGDDSVLGDASDVLSGIEVVLP